MTVLEALLERDRELAALEDLIEDARGNRGGMILVEAAGGLGKTSLLSAAATIAADAGFACLRAEAGELEQGFAYGCVRQLLEPEVARADPGRLFAGAAGLARPLFDPAAAAAPSHDNAFAVLHGVYWLLNNRCADGPVALFVDDLQWADDESLRLLAYLAPRLDGLPLAVVAAHRPGLNRTVDLARPAWAPEATVLRPRALSAEATAGVCRRRLGQDADPDLILACATATGGNPFFLDALLRELEDLEAPDADAVAAIGPREVARAVRSRLAHAPAAAGALLRALAVLGGRASLSEAAEVAGVDEAETRAAADRLVELGILQPSSALAFSHPILREAVYGWLGPGARAEAHAHAAAVLAAAGAADERVAAQIAHSQPAGDAVRVDLLRRVATDALARGAPAAAAVLLTRALAEPPPPALLGEILLELSVAKLRLGTPVAATLDLARASELLGEPEMVATAVRMLAEALTWAGDADAAVAAIGSAIETIGPEARESVLLLEAERAACAQLGDREVRTAVAAGLERYADLPGATPGERLVLASVAYERAKASESAAEAAAWIEGALGGHRLVDEQDLDVAGPVYMLLIGLLATDELDTVDAALERLLAQAQAKASIPAQAFALVHRGWAALRRGAVARAEADARTALELLTGYGIPLGTPYATGLLARALLEAGDVAAAETALGPTDDGDASRLGPTRNAFLETRALLRLAQGRMDDAAAELVAFGDHDARWGSAHPLASRWRSHAALALAALGEGARARAMAADDVERARRWAAPSGIGVALRAAALVQDGAATIDGLRAAADVLDGAPARLEHARALTDLGAALRRANRRAEAREPLEQAVRIAAPLGARAVADRARVELRAAGGRSGDPDGTGLEQLTASELRVAELAAAGRSNPEIAQSLFVTRKTVETHLGRVYRKLDISGRDALPRAFEAQT